MKADLRSDRPSRSTSTVERFGAHLALLLVVATVFFGCAPAQRSRSLGAEIDFPSPLSGPGRPLVAKTELKQLDKAWRLALDGQVEMARVNARAGSSPVAQLMLIQLDMIDGTLAKTDSLKRLAEEHQNWAGVWLTLAIAARDAGQEQLALDAARHGASIWTRPPWAGLPGQLEGMWIEERLNEASAALAEEKPQFALDLARKAVDLDPENAEAKMLVGRALIELERTDEARAMLEQLPDNPEATLLLARLAEERKDWLDAMNLYRQLPEDHEFRQIGLLRSQLRWRLSVLPDYVREALDREAISRADLAVVLIALAPDVEAVEGGSVPLLSDIVELPSQREVLTAVRAGLMQIDSVDHHFFPSRTASVAEVRDALDALAHLLDFQAPRWCDPEADDREATRNCISLDEPVSGPDVADIIMAMMQEDNP